MTWIFSIMLAAQAQQGFAVVEEEESSMPNMYIIQPGDTLWDLSTAFLGDPEYWPKLWSINEYITNPHWIYPGNEVVFTLGTEIDPPKIDIISGERDGYVVEQVQYESTDALCGPDVRFDFKQATGTFTVPGFLAESKDIEILGMVAASPKNQSFLIDKNKVYLTMNDPETYECGDTVTIFRKIKHRVRHPNSYFKSYGSMYQIVGEAKISHKYGNYIVAEIRTSYSEIGRGDYVGPLNPAVVQLDVNVPKGTLQGVIIDRLSQGHAMTIERDTVFLDRGSDDGVLIGDSFYVIQQRDDYQNDKEENHALPPSVIGRLVVVQVDEESSIAVVTDVSRDLKIGSTITQEVN
jgi:hypothetical protein